MYNIAALIADMLNILSPVSAAIAANVKHLQSKDARKHWEKLFSVTYVEPVLTSLDAAIAGALDIVANDDQQGVQNRVMVVTSIVVKLCVE